MPRPPVISPDDLTDALIRVVAGGGLDAVSIRSVAREAGVSLGAVQYHFATKDDLLHAAYERAIDRVALRAAQLPVPEAGPDAYIRALARELLPLDADREAELRVAIAFTARSAHSPRLTELYTYGYRALTDAFAHALELAVERGQAAPDVDPRRDAIAVAALADGLGWHLLCAPAAHTSDAALDALDAHIDRLLGGG